MRSGLPRVWQIHLAKDGEEPHQEDKGVQKGSPYMNRLLTDRTFRNKERVEKGCDDEVTIGRGDHEGGCWVDYD